MEACDLDLDKLAKKIQHKMLAEQFEKETGCKPTIQELEKLMKGETPFLHTRAEPGISSLGTLAKGS